jgi:UDP-2-acetamido-3-amino-2,3-dideoxy-glucuronate N-acetyltransferase
VPDRPANEVPFRCIEDVRFGDDVLVYSFANLYGCSIGSGSRIGTFVEIGAGATVGERCKIQSHTYICDGVDIRDEAFIGHGVVFVNDKYPRSTNDDGSVQTTDDWEMLRTEVCARATVGSGATILGGVTIGEGAIVGAGAVVTKDVEPGATVVGNPARAVASRRGWVAEAATGR